MNDFAFQGMNKDVCRVFVNRLFVKLYNPNIKIGSKC